MNYCVNLDPHYHVTLHAKENGKCWQEAIAEALTLIETLRAQGDRNDWEIMLCHHFLLCSDESNYFKGLAVYKAELDKARCTQPDVTLSPEALSDGMRVQCLISLCDGGKEYIEHCQANNGNINSPPSDGNVIWGLQSTETGRWIPNCDSEGVICLQIFRTRQLAERFQCEGNRVVWMHPKEWWKKVEDSATTGYPTNVIVLTNYRNGKTVELVYPIQTLVTGAPDEFIKHFNSQ
jgi:hypothetical protein